MPPVYFNTILVGVFLKVLGEFCTLWQNLVNALNVNRRKKMLPNVVAHVCIPTTEKVEVENGKFKVSVGQIVRCPLKQGLSMVQ